LFCAFFGSFLDCCIPLISGFSTVYRNPHPDTLSFLNFFLNVGEGEPLSATFSTLAKTSSYATGLNQSVAEQHKEKYDQKLKVGIIVRGQAVAVLIPCCAIKGTETWQCNEIRVSALLGINITLRFYFELRLTCSYLIGLWSAECGQVNQRQHVFEVQGPCATTFKSSV